MVNSLETPSTNARSFWRCSLLVALIWLVATCRAVAADLPVIDEGAPFDVRSAFVEPRDHVYLLSATLEVALSRAAQQALTNGVPVLLQLEFKVVRKRGWLPDVDVGSLTQRWHLSYDALTEHYLIKNESTGLQYSHESLAAALADLGSVQGLPVIDEALIQKGRRYEALLRLTASIEGGVPSALKYMMFWIDWRRSTEWYTWTLRP
jgi:hypothetical protein